VQSFTTAFVESEYKSWTGKIYENVRDRRCLLVMNIFNPNGGVDRTLNCDRIASASTGRWEDGC